jgi:hypothetical protein
MPNRYIFTCSTTVDGRGQASKNSIEEKRRQDIQSETTTRYSERDTNKVFKAKRDANRILNTRTDRIFKARRGDIHRHAR